MSIKNSERHLYVFYRFIKFMNVRHFLFIAVPTAPPLNVRFTKRSERKLTVSWNKPDTRRWSGITTRYKICHSTQERSSRPTCNETNRLSCEITSLQPSTKYFVTVWDKSWFWTEECGNQPDNQRRYLF